MDFPRRMDNINRSNCIRLFFPLSSWSKMLWIELCSKCSGWTYGTYHRGRHRDTHKMIILSDQYRLSTKLQLRFVRFLKRHLFICPLRRSLLPMTIAYRSRNVATKTTATSRNVSVCIVCPYKLSALFTLARRCIEHFFSDFLIGGLYVIFHGLPGRPRS